MATYEQAMASQQRRIQRHILRHASYLREIFYLQQNRNILDFDNWQQTENRERDQFVAQHGLKVDDPRLVSSVPPVKPAKRPGSPSGLPEGPAKVAKPKLPKPWRHKPKPKPTVDPIVEQHLLQHEARLVERIRALQTDGQWSEPRLPKGAEPPRQKLHFDYMLEEMAWMAEDFRQEKRWKLAVARHLAYAVKHWHEQQAVVKEAQRRTRLAARRHHAQAVAKQVTQFWRATLQAAEQQGPLGEKDIASSAISPTSSEPMNQPGTSPTQALPSAASVPASNSAVMAPSTLAPEAPNSSSSPPMDLNPDLPTPAAPTSAPDGSPEPLDDGNDDADDADYELAESDASDDELSSGDEEVELGALQVAGGEPLDSWVLGQAAYVGDVRERLIEPLSEDDDGEGKKGGRRRRGKKTGDDKDDTDDNDELKGLLQTLAEARGGSCGPHNLERLEACQKQLAKFKDTAVEGLEANVLLKQALKPHHIAGVKWWLRLYQEQCNGIVLHDALCGKWECCVGCMQA